MASTFILAGVMGWPVAHSRSPAIHQHWIAQHQLNGTYVLLPVAPERLGDAVRGLRALGFAGCNITIPHKVAAMAHVDVIDPAAKKIGAINTIVVRPNGELFGMNTDGFGYLASLRDVQADWRADRGPVVVLGAGGAARAILVALVQAGAPEIRLVNRSLDKAQALADELGGPITAHRWEDRHEVLDGAALLVNTTSLGMGGQEPLHLDLARLPVTALVSDIIYVPLTTTLLAQAQARGNPTVNGLGMLLHQARPAFEAWFGVMPEVTAELRTRIEATL
jgi:shikimate dehydrogenase